MTNEEPDLPTGNQNGAAGNKVNTDVRLEQIFKFLSRNPKIVFKSQQIDDPELTVAEKMSIALEVFEKNPKTFIMRFGPFLDANHIEYFEELQLPEEDQSEFDYLIEDLHAKLEKKKSNVKNRRYTAIQDMNDYFSETEMMKREPHLYHELVGQYLSEEERTKRDTYDVKNTSISGILLNKMDRDNAEEVLQKQQEQDDEEEEDTQLTNISSDEEAMFSEETETPQSYRQQWGNFDDENIPCSSSKVIKKQKKAKNRVKRQKFITAGEKEILRQEFVGIMHTKFLNGEDKEFDYSQVDDNAELDDLKQLNQDKEDEYFGESSEEDMVEQMDRDTEESEDDLDVYMSHLNQHHSLQTNASFM